ncbi:MAG TPA: hypothetical protein VFW11_19685 [Cyclobacteriaceae bacterium]|nr:hypothetical protein [Cyclobacteriaceae bacterium]
MIKFRLPFMLLAFANLIIGMAMGLIRMGWSFPVVPTAIHHGAIMVGGFLGTLILLEKVIPLKKKFLFAFPVINSLGLLMMDPEFYYMGISCLIAGAVGLLVVFIFYLKTQPKELSLWLMIAGACCQIGGHIMLVSKQFYPLAFPWWMGFLFLVIVGERVELSKFLPVTQKDKNALLLFSGFFLAGLFAPFHGTGKYLSAAGVISVALWLLRHDVISIAIKKEGLTRFSAYALLTGCIALIFTGVFLIAFPDLPFAYDAVVHTFFLGFVFSMIFAHGPIILPGVLGFSVKPYHPLLYVPLFTILCSLVLRILADITVLPYLTRLWSGWISVTSILMYFILLLSITIVKVRNAKTI